jgi:hypothetical protein
VIALGLAAIDGRLLAFWRKGRAYSGRQS